MILDSSQIIKFKNLDAFEDLISDFPGLKNLCSLIDLCNLAVLKSLYNPITSILKVWSTK